MELVVENDQTACGRLKPMQRFNEACQTQNLPISLTFDMGNWLWVGDSPEQAAQKLASTVGYIHVKAAVAHRDSYRAVPPDAADPRWLTLLKTLPGDVPRGIEFPRRAGFGGGYSPLRRVVTRGVTHEKFTGCGHYW